MRFWDKFRKDSKLESLDVSDDDIVSPATGKMIDISKVSDPMFAKQMLGKSVAFRFEGPKVAICSPANGTLTTLFPTGHAFGITRKDGVEILIHIGVDTVNSKGKGFELGKFHQNDSVKAGDVIVTVNYDLLSSIYDMSTMLILTNLNEKEIEFKKKSNVSRGESIIEK